MPAYNGPPWRNAITALLRTGATAVEAQLSPGPTADRVTFPDVAVYRLRIAEPQSCRPRLEAFLVGPGDPDQRRDAFFSLARDCIVATRLGPGQDGPIDPGRPPFTAPYWIGARESVTHVGRFDEKVIEDTVVERASGRVVASRRSFTAATIPPSGPGSGVACGGGWIGEHRLFRQMAPVPS